MKKINSITLESMKKELSTLNEVQLQMIKGGTINTNWSCLFDTMEILGKRQGVNHDANYYYEEFKNEYGYDPGHITGWRDIPGPMGTSRSVPIYEKVHDDDFTKAINYFGFSVRETTNYEYADGNQMLLIPQKDHEGKLYYHAVVGEVTLESGMINYTDPANGKTGYADPNESGFRMFHIRR
ncbi:MAG: hypothetical protein LIO93_09175 [Bacteroidales bacterium]|nr:hypothetical protein [Bacteroidales bacterium]